MIQTSFLFKLCMHIMDKVLCKPKGETKRTTSLTRTGSSKISEEIKSSHLSNILSIFASYLLTHRPVRFNCLDNSHYGFVAAEEGLAVLYSPYLNTIASFCYTPLGMKQKLFLTLWNPLHGEPFCCKYSEPKNTNTGKNKIYYKYSLLASGLFTGVQTE